MYQDPRVMSLSPGYGPKDGGTLITVSGTQLDAGQYQFVLVNSVPCRNVRSVLSLFPVAPGRI